MGACAPPRRARPHLCVSLAAVLSWKRLLALLRLGLSCNPRNIVTGWHHYSLGP